MSIQHPSRVGSALPKTLGLLAPSGTAANDLYAYTYQFPRLPSELEMGTSKRPTPNPAVWSRDCQSPSHEWMDSGQPTLDNP
jgi:hypothetical protein